MPPPKLKYICPKCHRRTTKKSLDEKGMCAACKRISLLTPYSFNAVAAFVRRRHAQDGVRWEGVLAEVRKKFRPPPKVERWELWHIVDIDSKRLNWGIK